MRVLFEECGNCDGVGWYEGGATLQTTCSECRGRGVVAVEPCGKRPITDMEHARLRRQIEKAERFQEAQRKRGAGPSEVR